MIEDTLKQVFGFDTLREGQRQVVETILSGQSSAAIFPTGSGKSLCYQLPALHLPHLTLVISPLLALMKDQLAFLQSKGIAAASIDSSQDRQQTQHVMQSVRNGETKILMISVERLKNERFRHFIAQVPISLLVIDEAHCMSEWGHNFRPDYLKLPHYKQQLNIPQVLLLTATATPNVIRDMQGKFSISADNTVVTGFYRSNLDLTISPCQEHEKAEALHRVLAQDPLAPSIIYVTLQQTAEQVAKQLNQQGLLATAYHAGLKSEQRDDIQQRFMNGQIHCIVATIAFGMGVDKSNIRQVVHYDLPKSIENYSQEIGRAGRDGHTSHCTLLANQTGLHVLENFVYGDTPDKEAIQSVIEEIYQQTGQWEVMLTRLSRESNIRQLPLKTLLVYLELAAVIEPKYSYFADYRFKFVATQQHIEEQFSSERRQFVEAIFACSPKARTWCQVDFEALWMHSQADRQRVIAAIDYFHEQGWIELESKQITDVFGVCDTSKPIQQLTEELFQLFRNKENAEINRLHEMLNFFQTEHCLSHRLASYFSDNNAPSQCGHCSVCRGNIATLPSSSQLKIDNQLLQQWLNEFRTASTKSSDTQPLSPEALARFLCGITTPLSTKLKARSMSGFAKLEQHPFSTVLEAVKSVSGIENQR
ncbi:RecQ family ATP-dependent DNA helicase [Vibrio sp. SCSIO 43135]|uniref:RecQ family ATP-dependent DNA helicase n=1 Tax=Vibrio sp. SCSIO 43135 TaxID=2819096 RepID=UPI002075D81D|nr:RecQ family ATP-dependent DNA helicase [Vibrio sp. SCSIO 43135]USD40536.1 RecQ family ATP-dependent DNA helicase [Vibrio sp. SCSIO 43135]